MTKQYNESEIIKEIGLAVSNLSSLYTKPCIKYKGKTKDTKEFYSEIASKELLSIGINELFSDKIKIPRENYKVFHTGKINKTSNRDEEILAIKLKDKELEYLGKILEYQIPLKSKGDDKGVGKIDLVSINNSEHKVFIIELKAEGNKEGLLKAILEIVTYSYQLNEDAFLKNWGIPHNKPIIKSVLLEKESLSYNEACELEIRPNLRELIKSLKVESFC
ncbi:MAG: hypothetical protein ACYC54_15240 [Sedimentisphaerales bacterium]